MSLMNISQKNFFLQKEEAKLEENNPSYIMQLCSQNKRDKIIEFLEKNKTFDFTALIDKKEYTCLQKF